MKQTLSAIFALFMLPTLLLAKSPDAMLSLRLGYTFGGTAPIPMPASIRKICDYSLQFSPQLGVDYTLAFTPHWAMRTAVLFENKAMSEDARVKSYHTEMIRGGQSIKGLYTGKEHTSVREWMFTVPVQAEYFVSKKLALRAGPYVSVLTSKSFTGSVYNGYIRVGVPTGAKIDIGNDDETKGTYDFSSNMRNFQWGIGMGADWYASKHLGAYAEFNWGMSGIHKGNFKSIEQTLYPMYATLGVIYKIK